MNANCRVNDKENQLAQPTDFAVPNWSACASPSCLALNGRYCRIELLNVERHAADLYEANSSDACGRNWTYLMYGPFETFETYRAWLDECSSGADPLFFAIVEPSLAKAVGVAAYLRIDTYNGSIEVGHINYSPLLQRTRAATEAMYLMMRHVFKLGYRRYEWKCNALNTSSRAAAQRLGFSFEGVFRQAAVMKGRNRDTAWYSVIDREWPALNTAFQQWLDPANFDEQRRQRTRLSDLTRPLLKNLV